MAAVVFNQILAEKGYICTSQLSPVMYVLIPHQKSKPIEDKNRQPATWLQVSPKDPGPDWSLDFFS